MVVPCSLKSCINHAQCVFSSGTVECRCPDKNECSNVTSVVCGSDGETYTVYNNECLMRVDSCKKGKRIVPVTPNKCGEFFFVRSSPLVSIDSDYLLYLFTYLFSITD